MFVTILFYRSHIPDAFSVSGHGAMLLVYHMLNMLIGQLLTIFKE